uniref:Candidate secreted effector n=1 Tax=Meloidogyne incognita TaxID=6306 RepID=A0A914KHR5_MELIC
MFCLTTMLWKIFTFIMRGIHLKLQDSMLETSSSSSSLLSEVSGKGTRRCAFGATGLSSSSKHLARLAPIFILSACFVEAYLSKARKLHD